MSLTSETMSDHAFMIKKNNLNSISTNTESMVYLTTDILE